MCGIPSDHRQPACCVLIAKQLAAAGAKLIVGVMPAGQFLRNCRSHAWWLSQGQS